MLTYDYAFVENIVVVFMMLIMILIVLVFRHCFKWKCKI